MFKRALGDPTVLINDVQSAFILCPIKEENKKSESERERMREAHCMPYCYTQSVACICMASLRTSIITWTERPERDARDVDLGRLRDTCMPALYI